MDSMTGRVGTDPDRRTSNSSVKFRLGTTRRVLRDGRWTDSETTWVSVRCWWGTSCRSRSPSISIGPGHTGITPGAL